LSDAGLHVLYADNHVLAVAKPAGLPSVPDDSGDMSMLDLAREWVRVEKNKPGNVFLGVVHRLDRPVSGVLLFARTSKAASRLSDAFRDRRVEKTYWGVTSRAPQTETGNLEQWLRKDRERNRVHVVAPESPESRRALTRWRTLSLSDQGPGRVLLELSPLTGRSHQLRVAAASVASPLLGDLKYGASEPLPDKSIALHARSLLVPHPTSGETLHLECPVPPLWVWRFS